VPTYVAFLRGINVGGKNKVAMPELRSMFEELGHQEVVSCVQSGNIVFGSRASAPAKLAAGIERAMAGTFGLTVSVHLRTRRDLEGVVVGNPFITKGAEFTSLHVMFLADAPEGKALAKLDPDRSPPDEFEVRGREIYLHYPNGSGRSKLTTDYFERSLGTSATARNWNTITKVLKLMQDMP